MSVGIATAAAFEREPSLVQEHALGALYETADGRRYRYVKVGSGAVLQGRVVAPDVASVDLLANLSVVSPVVRGATRLEVTNPAVPEKLANALAGGSVVICWTSSAVGIGVTYRINGHSNIGNPPHPATFTIDLDRNDPIVEDVPAALSPRIALAPSPYRDVGTFNTAVTLGPPVGATIVGMPANAYGWVQTRGPGCVVTTGTLVGQTRLYPANSGLSNATVSVHPAIATTMVAITAGFAGPCYLTFE